MQILLKAIPKRVKRKVERDHYWYDPDTKQMLHERGGEMRFRYERGKTIPYLVDHEDWVSANDYNDIMNWVKKNNVSVVDRAKGHYVLININDSEVEDITEDLYKNRIQYDH